MTSVNIPRPLGLLVLGLIFTGAGCASSSFFHRDEPREAPVQTPSHQLMTLTPAPIDRGDGTYGEGVSVRVYYFAGSDPNPVRVRGTMQFNLFELSHPVTPERKPDGVYRIAAEEMARHQRRDVVGTTYIFLLPYPAKQSTRVMVKSVYAEERAGHESSSTVTIEPVNAPPPTAAPPDQAKAPTQRNTNIR